MGHRIDLYYPEAPLGRWSIQEHANPSLPATAYSDFDCTTVYTNRILTSLGRDAFYVKSLVDVAVVNAAGTPVVTPFAAAVAAEAVAVRSNSFTGTDPDTDSQAQGGVAMLKPLLDLLAGSFGTWDFMVLQTGTTVRKTLKDALQAILLANNAGVFNVKSYGALGNGSTNDDAAFQAAKAALIAAGGGVFYCPASSGAYIVSQTIDFGATSAIVAGDQFGTSTISSTNGTAALSWTSPTYAGIRNIHITNGAGTGRPVSIPGGSSTSIEFRSSKFTGNAGVAVRARDILIDGCLIASDSGSSSLGLIEIQTGAFTVDARITNCRSTLTSPASRSLITVDGNVRLTVKNCSVSNTAATQRIVTVLATANSASKISIEGCQFDAPSTSYALAELLNPAVSFNEAGNVLWDNASAHVNPVILAAGTPGNITTSSYIGARSFGAAGASGSPIVGCALTTHVANANYTINAPVLANGSTAANPYNGAEIAIQIHNSTGGAITLTQNAAYKGGALANLAAATTTTLRYRYNNVGTVSGWILQGTRVDVT